MSWRIVIISQRCKLDYSMNYMVVRSDEIKRVLLDEIAVLVIENNAVSMTGCLLSMLTEKRIKVIFCDSKRNPQAELVPVYGAHNDAGRIREQINWGDENKQLIWTRIVREKITNQSRLLRHIGNDKSADKLIVYAEEILPGDSSNREGHAAKVYFNSLFGKGFSRDDENNLINAALNYGYSILLSSFNREIVACGYLMQLGIGHDNRFNHFNLSCDLMEPFRPLIDGWVQKNDFKTFGTEEKREVVNLLNQSVHIDNANQILINAIRIYTRSVFSAIEEGNPDLVRFYELPIYEIDRIL